MTTGTSSASANEGSAPTAAGAAPASPAQAAAGATGSTPKKPAAGDPAMPEGISSLFAAIAATAPPPTLPAPEGDRPVVAIPTSRSVVPDVTSKQQQLAPREQ